MKLQGPEGAERARLVIERQVDHLGYELAAHLRKLPGLADLRLIAITGYGQESDRQRTREAGFHHHLVKPVDLAAVEAAVGFRK